MTEDTVGRPVALVTGGSRGIGRAVCEALAATHDIIVGGRDESSVAEVAADLRAKGAQAHPFVAELTDDASTADAVDRLAPLLAGGLDVLVHSAGVARTGAIAELTREDWWHQLDVNVVAVADLTRRLLPALRSARGTVVAINSGAGQRSGPGGGSYAASKFALRALTDALREEERGRVRVVSIHPGRVDTDMQVELQDARGKDYVAADHLAATTVAESVRHAVLAPPEAMIEELSIRPVRSEVTGRTR
jgi:NADP-dependent 3-hydroxy acid dehydrogenase YdfG